jgi:hypothetical protein
MLINEILVHNSSAFYDLVTLAINVQNNRDHPCRHIKVMTATPDRKAYAHNFYWSFLTTPNNFDFTIY